MVRKRNKKGSIQDIVFIMVIILVITIVTLIVYKLSDEINTQFQANDIVSANSRATASMNEINSMYSGVLDNSFMLLVIGLALAAIVLASMVRIHPIFFIFFIIILVIIIFLAGVFSNIYQKIASNEEMEDLADNLVYMTYVMRFLPFITGVIGFIMSFIMYKTWQNA